jgi:L-fucose dehydrogenase
MDLNLKNKVVMVTGGGTGTEEAIANCLAMEGAIPVIVGPGGSQNDVLAKSLNARGIPALSIVFELGESNSAELAVNKIIEKFGRIDAIVNNGATNDWVGLESATPERFRESIKINLFHYYDIVHYAVPALKISKGSIVNIASRTPLTGEGNASGYAAAKGGVLGLTREWAVELLKSGVRINVVVPGELLPPGYKKSTKISGDQEEKFRQIKRRIPLSNRMTTHEEIADMVVFLLSSGSTHITGEIIFVDGGYVHLDRSIPMPD